MLWLDRFCRSRLVESTSNSLENVRSQPSIEYCVASCFHNAKSCRPSITRHKSLKTIRSIALVGRSFLAQVIARSLAKYHIISSVGSAPEQKAKVSVHLVQNHDWDLRRFSSWTKLLRVTAYVIRLTQRCRKDHFSKSSQGSEQLQLLNLYPDEVNLARNFWLKTIQRQLFSKKYERIREDQSVTKGSKLSALNPFLDATRLIRFRGQLRHSVLPEQTKHPIVIASHPLVSLLIEYTHVHIRVKLAPQY